MHILHQARGHIEIMLSVMSLQQNLYVHPASCQVIANQFVMSKKGMFKLWAYILIIFK